MAKLESNRLYDLKSDWLFDGPNNNSTVHECWGGNLNAWCICFVNGKPDLIPGSVNTTYSQAPLICHPPLKQTTTKYQTTWMMKSFKISKDIYSLEKKILVYAPPHPRMLY